MEQSLASKFDILYVRAVKWLFLHAEMRKRQFYGDCLTDMQERGTSNLTGEAEDTPRGGANVKAEPQP